MKTYVMTTGSIFGLITLVHVWRGFEEGPHVASNPWYLLLTLLPAALCLWAGLLLRRSARARPV